MLAKLKEILVKYVDIDPNEIKKDSRLGEDLGLTSFALMSMMGEVEDVFDITIVEEELTGITTVDDIMKYIRKKQKEN
ncbi:MAG: acyl carrier protein [Eubacterium sp.]|nr:acyl carrier protein [Eubacterium sp.]